jgi:histidinol-phosphate/aromatic aminotransferase/cobyric acid decarboxylase-like protein
MNPALFSNCFHGGAFFSAVGENFDSLERARAVINADVLDAWFPPAPEVIEAVTEYLPWLLRTSPPTHCTGLIEAIAEARGVPAENILPGAGSSDLIFRALRNWLTPASRVLILDPTYGEYAHVLKKVIGCHVSRFALRREDGYAVSARRLHAVLQGGWDLVVLVNPNSPTGRHLCREELTDILGDIPRTTRVWVDETYVEYAGVGQSIEPFATYAENVVVCKSMSKVYALSGARVAYLCGPRSLLDPLRLITPPWVVGLPSQLAAVRALQNPAYYLERYAETHTLRKTLTENLVSLGWDVIPGVANFLLCHLPAEGVTAAQLVPACQERGLFLRDAAAMGAQLGPHAVRLAVKDELTNQRMFEIVREVSTRLNEDEAGRSAVLAAAQ